MKAKVKPKSKKSPSKANSRKEELLGLKLAIHNLEDSLYFISDHLVALEDRTFWDLFLSKGGRP